MSNSSPAAKPHSSDPIAQTTSDEPPTAMPPASTAPPFSLTLILAATPSLGIGKGGTLPWPQLKKEMGYFARVTKRVPPRPAAPEGIKRCNAVIMGRKTWDSIPEKFRPLKGRLNVVLTKKPEGFTASQPPSADAVEGPVVASSITTALKQLRDLNASIAERAVHVERVFVIGGASIYKAALGLPQTDRVLLTKIHKEYECDTFFHVDLDKDGSWKRAGRDKLEEYVGEEVVGEVEEGGLRFEFCLYERQGR